MLKFLAVLKKPSVISEISEIHSLFLPSSTIKTGDITSAVTTEAKRVYEFITVKSVIPKNQISPWDCRVQWVILSAHHLH